MEKYIVGLGAANVDIHGHSRQNIIMRDSNPGTLTVTAGGVTRNIIENATRLGCKSYMLTAIGDNPLTSVITSACEKAGMQLIAKQVKGVSSSGYISVLDNGGDMLVAVSDMSIMDNLDNAWLDEQKPLVQSAAAAVCDGCLPPSLMEHFLFDTAKGVPVFADTVSSAYALTIKRFIPHFHTVKPNRMELSILSDMPADTDKEIEAACDKLLSQGLFRIAVSLGGDGCYIADRNGSKVRMRHRPVENLVNAGGGGDAFMGALVRAFVLGLDNEQAADWALAAGALAVQAATTINPDLCESAIFETIKERKL